MSITDLTLVLVALVLMGITAFLVGFYLGIRSATKNHVEGMSRLTDEQLDALMATVRKKRGERS